MKRVLIVGDRAGMADELPGNLSFDETRAILDLQAEYCAARRHGAYDAVARCSHPTALPELVGALAGARKVDVLDILDHGTSGVIRLGNQILFQMDAGALVNEAVLIQLHDVLRVGASLRLLGCRTATGPQGRALLRHMARVSKFSLRIYGTLDRVQPIHFSEPGFLGTANELFSSEAAIDNEAPTWTQRKDNLQTS